VATHGRGDYFKQAKAKSLVRYQQEAKQYAELLAYVERSNVPGREALLPKLKEKVNFAQASVKAVTASRMQRLMQLPRNASGYLRYSQLPLRSVVRDLLL